MSKKDTFLYQINFNRKKYPEICQALEDSKEGNGIAWYIRNLVKEDLKRKESLSGQIEEKPVYEKPKPKVNNRKENKKPSMTDSGGFL